MPTGDIVICPDAGCIWCSHGEPHELGNVDSSCGEGGDYNCPHCVPYIAEESKGG